MNCPYFLFSLGTKYPVACHVNIIPAHAGIQMGGRAMDSGSEAGMTLLIPRCLRRDSSFLRAVEF